MPVYLVNHYWEGSTDSVGVFSLKGDAERWIEDRRLSYAKGIRDSHEFEILELELNPAH